MAELIECRECGSEDLEWAVTTSTNGVAQGRLNSHDMYVVAYLSCNECSETLLEMDGDDIALVLNNARSRP